MKIQDIAGRAFCCAKCGGQEVSTTGNPKFVTCDKCGKTIDAHNASILGQVIPLKAFKPQIVINLKKDEVWECSGCLKIFTATEDTTLAACPYCRKNYTSKVSPKVITQCPLCASLEMSFVDTSRTWICRSCGTFFTELGMKLSQPESLFNPTRTRKALVEFLSDDE